MTRTIVESKTKTAVIGFGSYIIPTHTAARRRPGFAARLARATRSRPKIGYGSRRNDRCAPIRDVT